MAGKKGGKDDQSWRFTLTVGSKYKVTSLGTKDEPIVSTGTFAGYTMVGNIDAIVLALEGGRNVKDKEKDKDKGKGGPAAEASLRIIPSHMILTIDVISAKKGGPEKEDTPATGFYM